jgi:hypothetical protein
MSLKQSVTDLHIKEDKTPRYPKEQIQKINGNDFRQHIGIGRCQCGDYLLNIDGVTKCLSCASKKRDNKDLCPICENRLIYIQGCKQCIDDACAWSACGK